MSGIARATRTCSTPSLSNGPCGALIASDTSSYRYSGMQEEENTFVGCTARLAQALCHLGCDAEPASAMDTLVGAGNAVGLLSEEIDPSSGELLGNFPQGLSHLGVWNAALALTGEPPARPGSSRSTAAA